MYNNVQQSNSSPKHRLHKHSMLHTQFRTLQTDLFRWSHCFALLLRVPAKLNAAKESGCMMLALLLFVVITMSG